MAMGKALKAIQWYGKHWTQKSTNKKIIALLPQANILLHVVRKIDIT